MNFRCISYPKPYYHMKYLEILMTITMFFCILDNKGRCHLIYTPNYIHVICVFYVKPFMYIFMTFYET